LPKGHIEPGESRQQTALREVREEAGLSDLRILTGLGHQMVEFDWKGNHYVRDESYFLMMAASNASPGRAEKQFKALWLTWKEALARLSFDAERAWVRRAQVAWAEQHKGESGAAAG
jgi:8-oxo-dGTP pyrophosphatase MutT (NUDIX family)